MARRPRRGSLNEEARDAVEAFGFNLHAHWRRLRPKDLLDHAPAVAKRSFPFVGAGEANYFEWAEMLVCFERMPTKTEAAAISKRVPAPLRDTVEWDGRVLRVASEQGVGRVIESAYGKAKKAPSKLTTRSQFKIAPTSAYARFNAEIDEWLAFAHTKAPILVAFRGEDAEAGGTELSDWHRESVETLPKVLAKLAADGTGAAAKLGVLLTEAAKRAKVKVGAAVAKKLARLAREAEREEEDQFPDWDALAKVAKQALGAPAPAYDKKRSGEELEPVLAVLAKVLPLSAKRLRSMSKKPLTVRPGASASALAAVEKALGTKLSKEHRALLQAFDGGQIGKVTVLGTAAGGAVRDAELAAFTRAWSGKESEHVIVAHTKRNAVIALPRGKAGPATVFSGKPGWGGGSVTRECKALDTALDLALKEGRVPDGG